MRPRTFAGLAVAAVVSVTLALFVYATANTWNAGAASGAKMLPPLSADRVASVAITRGDQALTLERKGSVWTIKERDGYPANPDKIRALMAKLDTAELIEPKTKNPDRYGLLNLEDPAKKDAKSTLVRVADDKGDALAEVVVGKQSAEQLGAGKSGTYVRKPGDAQTWLTNAELVVPSAIASWVDTMVLETKGGTISRITIEIPGEAPLVVEKDKEKSGYKLADVPADRKLKNSGAAGQIADAFQRIELEDVRKLAGQPGGENAGVASFDADGGLKVTVRLRRDGDSRWISIEAHGDGDAKQTADKINARASGWEFKISSWKADQIFKRRADLFESA